MSEINYQTLNVPLGFPDCKNGLLVFGIILIILGAVAGCFVILMPLALVMPQPPNTTTPPPSAAAILGALPLYLLSAVGLIWTGIGSIRRQRWVRPIVVTLSAFLLFIGAIALIVLLVGVPTMQKLMQASATASGGTLPPGVEIFAAVVMVVVALVFYIILPGLFQWYYRKEDVRKTLEFYDPTPRWTDQLPLPVLGLSIVSALMAVFLCSAMVQGIVPLFGMILRGAPASAVLLAVCAGFVAAAVLIYRQKVAGWWILVAIIIGGTISSAITLVMMDPMELYNAIDMPIDQARIVADSPMIKPIFAIPMLLISAGGMLGFTIWVKRRYPFDDAPPITANTQ